jgi:hypothetical protein
MKSIALRTLVSVIGMLIAATTAVSVPLGYFVVGYTNTAGLLDFRAGLNARSCPRRCRKGGIRRRHRARLSRFDP